MPCKHALIPLLLSMVIVGCGTSSVDPEVAPDTSATAQGGFEFVVVLDNKGASFEARHGVDWETLSWSTSGSDAYEMWLNPRGVAGEPGALKGDGFLIKIEEAPDGAMFKSTRGTDWISLEAACAKMPCRFLVTEAGVTVQ